MKGALQILLETLEADRSLHAPDRLRERLDALDRLDALMPLDGEDAGAELQRRGRAIRMQMEAANAARYRAIRREIRQGKGRDALLCCWHGDRQAPAMADAIGDGYDWRDELVAGVLPFGEPGEASVLPPEMVFYQPTPARHVFDLLDRLALDRHDVLVDLGSGLGHVPLLAAICTKARGVGVEIKPAYVQGARACARALQLANAQFVQGDAREADFAIGSVFYLYTPFTGTVLRSVLDALRREAGRRAFRVCSFGPCTAVLAAEPWLEGNDGWATDRVAIFRTAE
ncbi:methyltransferase domain-containing protein [Rhodanobacter sp. DHB23]|uniref:methyltransferase domain-containing protein n=1 Tax=Rhodanobacter sp. DHB23 TaxID=2775923 RepID=UPI001781E584|nr:methyltransferase domain-containing protein [Rhodanobacter sp. DHB23]MBD8874067.1 methyltransferase domain-containing protein [Rhodanobacter sp. DHB23]